MPDLTPEEAGVPDGRVTTEDILMERTYVMEWVAAKFPENSRLKAIALTQMDLAFGALLLLRAE